MGATSAAALVPVPMRLPHPALKPGDRYAIASIFDIQERLEGGVFS